MSHNKDLTQRIDRWTEQAEAASTASDLHSITADMVAYGQPIKYKLGKLYLAATAFFGVAIWLGMAAFGSGPTPQWLRSLAYEFGWQAGSTGLALVGASGLLSFILFGIALKKEGKITHLCNAIMHRASLLQYGLKRIDDSEIASQISSFGELRRGNYERNIHESYEGTYQGDEHTFIYRPYRLHYVDRIERQEYDHQNKRWETKVTYEHYDRSGIVVNFPYAKGIHVCQGYEKTLYGAPYKPASLEFNNAFHCRGEDEMTLARFLKPATVVHLTEAARDIPSLSVEVNQNGIMCLGCSHHHVVQSIQKLTKETNPRISPEGFDKFIRASVDMPRLDRLNELAHTLMRFNDSNFSRKSA
jgi:hypothetical protein